MSRTDTQDAIANVPAVLRQRRQWVGFKLVANGDGKPKKVPAIATDPDKNASSTRPATWRSYREARAGLKAGRFDAIGYALNGDVVGIDLDGERWVVGDGELSEEAQALVERFGTYSEWSVSGRGLHVLLSGDSSFTGRANHAAGVELYSRQRFFIVTGQRIDGTPAELRENPAALAWLIGQFFQSAESTETAEASETAENTEGHSSAVSAVSAVSADEIINSTLPKIVGHRNACLFRLARGLKFDAGMARATFAELRPLVQRWHALALPTIGTQPFDDSWADFVRGWRAARLPLTFKAEAWAADMAQAEPLPAIAGQYDTPAAELLVGMCWQLSTLNKSGRFFLSSHAAGPLIGVGHDKAFHLLAMLCADGVLELAERGNERRANRYRWTAAAPQPARALPTCGQTAQERTEGIDPTRNTYPAGDSAEATQTTPTAAAGPADVGQHRRGHNLR